MQRIPIIAVLFAVAIFAGPLRGWSGEAGGPKHARPVRVTLRNGSSELVQLEGVGCDKSICSRVAVNGHISLDRLDTIREVCDGRAQFVFSDGTEQGVTVIPDNRVLYVTGADGHAKKSHLDALKSLRFMSRASQ
jgi:hypothetical protein